MSGFKFFTIFISTAVCLLVLVAGFNLWVDPFAMYRMVNVEGLNTYKPEIYTRVRLFKAFELRRVRPQTVILGSSRTHVGLSCTHKSLALIEGPCYNLAFDGATTREMYAYLRHAQAIRPLKHVVLGLDSYHASSARSFTRPDFDPLVLYEGDYPWLPRWLTADLRLLTSFNTLTSSIKTLRAQENAEPDWFAPDGQRLGTIFFHRPSDNFMRHGPRAYFDEIDLLEVGFQSEGIRPDPSRPVTVKKGASDSAGETSLAYIRKIIDFCRLNKIDLHIYITPAHVHQLEITAAVGGWPAIEEGKRALVRILNEEASQHIGSIPYTLLDFNGYSFITTEALPPQGSRDEMKYYWESSHFKDILGEYILDRLFTTQNSEHQVPSDFGIKLTSDTIEPWLAITRQAQADYRIRFADDVAALKNMVNQVQGPETTDPAMALN
ncbi:MAG: hypothetical protein LUO94_07215 [Methylococcaceae bacterium]|nr:hypothetical protein [Methylococcaceae bacterium]